VNQADVERIAQATLRELGVVGAIVTVTSEARPGEGSTAQWVRQQIFEQYTAQS
jgi:hypothetical protein